MLMPSNRQSFLVFYLSPFDLLYLFPVNYVSNDCLKAAGGKANGVLDFYQIHTYAYQGAWSSSGPFNGVSEDHYFDDS